MMSHDSGGTKFGISDVSISKFNVGDLTDFISEEGEEAGVQKIRFCLEQNGWINIAPMFYPHYIVGIYRTRCQQLSGLIRLCDMGPMGDSSGPPCRECLELNLHTRVWISLHEILSERLRNSDFTIQLSRIGCPWMEYRYRKIKQVFADLASQSLGISET